MFTLVYLGLWGAAGVPVYLAMRLLRDVPGHVVAYGVAAVLIAAGVYQMSPLKHVCLRACRSPFGFLLGRWRAGRVGSLRLGAAHAMYCLGCCWALMAVLVGAGAMGLAWVLFITAIVAAEKLVPRGEWVARATGVALVLLGIAVVVHPDLVTALRGAHGM
jgi:predicted metal-binding membrane protein